MRARVARTHLQQVTVCCVCTVALIVSVQLKPRTTPSSLVDTVSPCNDTPIKHIPDLDELQGGVSARALKHAVEAAVVFSMVRFDLLEQHLASIDHPVRQLFVVHNYATENTKSSTISITDRYSGCPNSNKSSTCLNPNIAHLSLLASPHNLGFSGSMNLGIKAVMYFNLAYAFFSGDDTRFRPGRLEAAARIVDAGPEICMFHFEGYSSFVLTKRGIRKIGPFDENFWPAYAEDCDYWFRAQVVSCRVYYRGGYTPDKRTEKSIAGAFLDHGDTRDPNIISSVTYRSDSGLGRLIERTLDANRGRFAYLTRKWGSNVCDDYHSTLNDWREHDVILDPVPQASLLRAGKYLFPYNDSNKFQDSRRWLQEDWKEPGAISSRAVNAKDAPASLAWQESDYLLLNIL